MGWTKYAEDNYEIYIDREREAAFLKETSSHVFYKPFVQTKGTGTATIEHASTHPIKKKHMEFDLFLFCKDCGNEFIFPVSSQKYFEKQGWIRPIRCKKCREAKKARLMIAV